jgi:lipopolysaccharide export system protein LptC
MSTRGSLWLPLLILLLLAGLSYWIEQSVQLSADGEQAAHTDPEGIMDNFDALRTDPAGNPQYRLSAKRLKHYSGSRLTEMESPRFVHLDPKAGEIAATANQATVSSSGNQVDLLGDVNVVRAAHAGRSAMTLRTQKMLLFPELKLMRAPGRVDVHDDTLDASAGAMEYDANQRIIKLTGRVKARYISGSGSAS